MKRFLQSLFLLIAISSTTLAQERTITGTITSRPDGLPVPNASIKIKGTTISGFSDGAGRYSIKTPSIPAVLIISYIGYVSQEVNVTNQSIVNVGLQEDANQLNEVLVVSYGTTNKKVFTGSVGQIDAKDFEKRPITNALSSVVGSVPGVSTTIASGAPGSSPGIRIRGFGSINASSDALVVVDGAVYNGGVSNINPDDIETISLLKDAATTALYGSRASNGVVQITTKKGRIGKPTLNFKATSGWLGRGLQEYERVDAFQYYPVMWEGLRNSLTYGSARIPLATANGIASGTISSYNGISYSGINTLLGYNPFNVPGNQIVGLDGAINPNAQLLYADDLDWAEQAAQGGKQRQNYNMTYSGASETTDYFGSFGYTNEEGYLVKSSLKRYNARLNVNTQPLKWFKTGINLAGTYIDSQFDNVDDGGGSSFINPFYISRYIGPIYPVNLHDAAGNLILDENGNKRYDFGDGRPFSQGRHTIFENLQDSQNDVRAGITSRAYATINLYKGLKFTTNISFDLEDIHRRTYDNPILGDGAPAGRSYHYLYRTTNSTFNQILDYTKDFGKHHLDVLAAHENFSYRYNTLTGAKTGQIVEGIVELPNFSTITSASSNENNATVESYFSRLNYNFDQKYLFSASLRRDGNSKFAPEVRWDNFWSVGGGWNVSEESFFKVGWIDQLKLRSSYGVLGNAEGLGNFPYQALYQLGNNNAAAPGLTQQSLANNELTWETSKNFDVGIDFSLLKGRIGGSFEYYNRITDGLIFDVPISLSSGGTTASATNNFTIPTNIGAMHNRGLELTINAHAVKSNDFNYRVGLNLTTINNQITKMPDQNPIIIDGTKAYSVGHSVYDFYLRDFYGVDPQNGDALYRTNTVTSNSRIIGQDTLTTVHGEANLRYVGASSIPDLAGSMNHTLSYKNFSLNFQFTFQLGGKVYDGAYASLMHSGNYGTALSTDILNRWQTPGQVTSVPRMDGGQVVNLGGGNSSRWLTNASYLQLNSANLSYNIPKEWLSKINAKNASLFVSGENLALLSKRKGMNVSGSFSGTTNNSYNYSRIVSVGLNVTF